MTKLHDKAFQQMHHREPLRQTSYTKTQLHHLKKPRYRFHTRDVNIARTVS